MRHEKPGSVVSDLKPSHLHPHLDLKVLNPSKGCSAFVAGFRYEPQGHLPVVITTGQTMLDEAGCSQRLWTLAASHEPRDLGEIS